MSKYVVDPYIYQGKYNVISLETAEVVSSFNTLKQAQEDCDSRNEGRIIK